MPKVKSSLLCTTDKASGSKIFKSSQDTTSTSEGSHSDTPQLTTDIKSSSRNDTRDPPDLNKVLPSLVDIKAITKPSKDADLPVDILLLTVTNCEFLACYSELKKPYRCWFDGLGYVYFSDVGESQKELKVALLRCYRNGIGPGGALVSVKNAASVLRPKAVISVGTCSGLNPAKSKLGDVVVSAKLATYASKVVTNNQEQSTGMRSYVSKRFLNVIKNCADGWQAPFENPETQQVQVYTDAEFLTGPEEVRAEWWRDQLAEASPQAMAIENEGEGVFTAAFDCQIEWLIVKGIADYADGSQLPSENWSSCASVMAASLVAHILSDPCVFHSWPHYQDISEQSSASRSKEQLQSPSDSPSPAETETIERIRQLYITCQQRLLPIPWRKGFSFHLNDIFTKFKIVRKDKTRGVPSADGISDITAIFKEHPKCQRPRTVLIEGDPGIGKSTFCQKIAYDWATKQEEWDPSFPEIEVLLLLRCHEMKYDIWEAIRNQILSSYVDDRTKECFFRFIRENQTKVLLVLDGLDEANPRNLEMILNLLKSKDLPGFYLVLFSRHDAGGEFRMYCDSLFEIKGFAKEDAIGYIRKYFENINKEHLAEKLIETIWPSNLESKSTDLCALTNSPLNTTLLCVLCEDYEGVFPKSRTQLYIDIVRCVLRLYDTKRGISSTRDDLIIFYKADLSQLGAMAFQSLQKGESYIEVLESDSDFIVLSKFGFLSLQTEASMTNAQVRFAFLHKSFQDFFSGLHLAWQIIDTDIDCDSVVTDQRYKIQLDETFSFMTGILASMSEDDAERLVESMARNINSASCQADEVLFASKCLSESSRLARVLGKHLDLTHLDFRGKELKDSYTVACFSMALAVNASLTNLNLESTGIGNSGAAFISQVLKDNSSLTDLNLNENGIDASGAASLAEALEGNSSLAILDLRWNSFRTSGAVVLSRALEANSSLTFLDLSYNLIGSTGVASLSQALKANSSLTNLNLSSNDIGASGATSLSQALATNSSLTHLDLSCNEIGASGATSISQALATNSSLTHLDLSSNNICDYGAASLSEYLVANFSLASLNLRCNRIGAFGAGFLSQCLKANSSLTSLDLQSNAIGDYGAALLSNAVAVNSSLTYLNLHSNRISDSGATSLAKALQANFSSSLTDLDLDCNLIGFSVSGSVSRRLAVNLFLTTVARSKLYIILVVLMTLVLLLSFSKLLKRI